MNRQFKKGVINLCVLSFLEKQDIYGYELVQVISRKMEISEGFMYLQLLRRLTTEKFFTTYLRGSPEGLLRKYYQITNVGKENLKALRAEWQHFIEGVNELILEEGIG